MATSTAVPTATATSTPEPVVTRTALPSEARVALSKSKSKFNGFVGVALSGFTPSSLVTLRWPDGTILATATTDPSGVASTLFRTPLVALGTYRVEARDDRDRSAATQLSVIPRIMLNVVQGPTDTRLRVYFYGFAPGERVEVRWYATDELSFAVIKTVLISDNGRGSNLITIPAGTGLGSHKVMGRVIGVARSASTPFLVTAGGVATADVAPPSAAASPTSTATPLATSTPTPTPTPTLTDTPPIEPSPTASPTAAPTAAPSATPTPEPTATPTPDAQPTPTPSGEPTPELATAVAAPDPEETPTA